MNDNVIDLRPRLAAKKKAAGKKPKVKVYRIVGARLRDPPVVDLMRATEKAMEQLVASPKRQAPMLALMKRHAPILFAAIHNSRSRKDG